MAEESTDRVVAAAERVWAWVGPGYPDLDDAEERELFMKDVTDLAAAWFGYQTRKSVA